MLTLFKKGAALRMRVSDTRGIVLFVAVVIVAITVAAALAIGTIFIKELQLAQNMQSSSRALFAADAGLETSLYHERVAHVCAAAEGPSPIPFEVSTTDPEGDDVQYRIEIDTDPTFTSPALQVFDQSISAINWSGLDGAAAGGNSYKSGSTATYSFSAPAGTYFWRVQAKDPGGSNAFGPFSLTSSFDILP